MEKTEHDGLMIQTVNQLLDWINENDLTIELSPGEGRIIIDYLEGHDYRIMTDGCFLYRLDVAEENGVIELNTIDEIIDTVCEWNYELLTYARDEFEKAEGILQSAEYLERVRSLERDETLLDTMFSKTIYGRTASKAAAAIVCESDGLREQNDLISSDIHEGKRGGR